MGRPEGSALTGLPRNAGAQEPRRRKARTESTEFTEGFWPLIFRSSLRDEIKFNSNTSAGDKSPAGLKGPALRAAESSTPIYAAITFST